MDDTFILGQPKYQTASRISMQKQVGPLSVGDIVAPWKFYKNGKPVQQAHWDYRGPGSNVGVVIKEDYLEVNQDKFYNVLVVRWTTRSDMKDGIYVKETSGSYLTKLS
jgi:hypothetical protein